VEITSIIACPVLFAFDGRDWPLLFTHRVLLQIEARLSLSILNGELDIVRVPAKALRTILCVALSASGGTYSESGIGARLGVRGIGMAKRAAIDAWIASMPEADAKPKPGAEAKPKLKSETRSWMDVWANNRYYLRLTDEEWLGMTPRMVQALDRARREDRRRWELMISRVAAVTANYGFCRPKKAIRDDHFMLDPWDDKDGLPDSEAGWDFLLGVDGPMSGGKSNGSSDGPSPLRH
jgi:hypothetical protein